LYTAQYGCDHYPGALYSTNQTQSNADTDSLRGQVIETSSGDFPALLCVAPYGQHVAGAAFFTTFTLLAFIVLSLFVGIITLSMLEQMETHIRSKTNDFKAEEFRNQLEVKRKYIQRLTHFHHTILYHLLFVYLLLHVLKQLQFSSSAFLRASTLLIILTTIPIHLVCELSLLLRFR